MDRIMESNSNFIRSYLLRINLCQQCMKYKLWFKGTLLKFGKIYTFHRYHMNENRAFHSFDQSCTSHIMTRAYSSPVHTLIGIGIPAQSRNPPLCTCPRTIFSRSGWQSFLPRSAARRAGIGKVDHGSELAFYVRPYSKWCNSCSGAPSTQGSHYTIN